MFLLGNVYPNGRWFYFPVAFAIKSSLALLLLLPFGLLCPRLYRHKRRALLFLLLPVLVNCGASLRAEMNIGVRHILPIYPFLIVELAPQDPRTHYQLAGVYAAAFRLADAKAELAATRRTAGAAPGYMVDRFVTAGW